MIKDYQQRAFRLATTATFTADPLRRVIAFWGKQLGARFEARFAPYNQVLQTLIDPASELGGNTHGVNIALLRLEDLSQDTGRLDENVRQFAEELRSAPARFGVPLLVVLCPSVPGSAHDAAHGRLERQFASMLNGAPGVHFLTHHALERLYPVTTVHSPEGERLGRIPYSEAYFCALGTLLVRHAHALVRAPFKLIALDCDNTLWQGICGEDGPENVVLDDPRRQLQQFMLDQREDGVLLTLASKNNEEDALETFRVHPEFPLQPEHFVTWRLNWAAKADNLASMAEQLSLGLDSFIFVDDNPKECAELEDALPEVLTLALPTDIGQAPHFLRHVWAFDHPVVTEEDRNRNAYYARAAEFGNEVRRARSMADFQASLRLRVQVEPVTPERLPRASQLTQRTNQFNTTTIRRTEGDLTALMAAGGEVLIAEASDRFGDYGVVGVMVLQPAGESLVIDNMLLSCRALGRGVEHAMLAHVGRLAVERGIARVQLPFERTAKNKPALDFVQSLGFPAEGGEAAVVAAVEWTPSTDSGRAGVVAPKPKSTEDAALNRSVDYACIALRLSTVPDILDAMRRSVTVDESMSDTERQLAAIWADLLDRPVIRREDNFFDLGGHSLLAVLLLMRVHETFGLELPIDDVYTGGLTLAGLAERIDAAAQFGEMDPAEYAALLAEIENLSDDEVRELLAREDGQA